MGATVTWRCSHKSQLKILEKLNKNLGSIHFEFSKVTNTQTKIIIGKWEPGVSSYWGSLSLLRETTKTELWYPETSEDLGSEDKLQGPLKIGSFKGDLHLLTTPYIANISKVYTLSIKSVWEINLPRVVGLQRKGFVLYTGISGRQKKFSHRIHNHIIMAIITKISIIIMKTTGIPFHIKPSW